MSYKKKKKEKTISPVFSSSQPQAIENTTVPDLSENKLDIWSKKILLLLFTLLFAIVPLFFTWFNEELFEFNKMVAVYFFTILIGATWLMRSVWTKKIIFKRTFLDIPLLIFFLSQFISTLLSLEPRTSIFGYYTRFNAGLLPLFCYILLFYALISNFAKKDLPRLLWANICVSILVSFYAILEHFGHSFSCLLINWSSLKNGQIDLQSAFGVSCWVQLVQERVFATFGQPNWLASYLITLIPLNLSLLIIGHTKNDFFNLKKSTSFWLWLSTAFMMTALLFTKSRSGFLGFAISLFIFILGWIIINWPSKNKFWNKQLLLFGGVLLSIILIFGTPYSPSLKQIFQKISTPSTTSTVAPSSTSSPSTPEPTPAPIIPAGGTDSGEIRKIVWKGAIAVWKRYPIFGSGLETFGYSYYLDRPMEHNLVSEWDFLYNKAHNEFLNYLATTGLFGLATYLFLLGFFSFYTLKTILNRNHDLNLRIFSLGLLCATTAMMIANFFGFSTVFSNVLLFSIFAFYIIAVSPSTPHLSSELKNSDLNLSSPAQITCTLALLLLSTLTLKRTLDYWVADNSFFVGKALIRKNTLDSLDRGLGLLKKAALLEPHEALFYSELADTYAQIAVAYFKQNQTEAASKFTSQAIAATNESLRLNPAQLNYYKTALRVYLNLAQIDLNYMNNVEEILLKAIALAPTDAKLRYNLAIIYFNTNRSQEGFNLLRKIVTQFKPDYLEARYYLAQRALETGYHQEAADNFSYILNYVDPYDLRAVNGLAAVSTMSGVTISTPPKTELYLDQ